MGRKRETVGFPPARIKRMMQSDDDVGKIATNTPALVGKALELMIEDLVRQAIDVAKSRSTKTITPQHLKYCVEKEDSFDFLRSIFSKIPDIQPESEFKKKDKVLPPAEFSRLNSDGTKKRGRTPKYAIMAQEKKGEDAPAPKQPRLKSKAQPEEIYAKVEPKHDETLQSQSVKVESFLPDSNGFDPYKLPQNKVNALPSLDSLYPIQGLPKASLPFSKDINEDNYDDYDEDDVEDNQSYNNRNLMNNNKINNDNTVNDDNEDDSDGDNDDSADRNIHFSNQNNFLQQNQYQHINLDPKQSEGDKEEILSPILQPTRKNFVSKFANHGDNRNLISSVSNANDNNFSVGSLGNDFMQNADDDEFYKNYHPVQATPFHIPDLETTTNSEHDMDSIDPPKPRTQATRVKVSQLLTD